MGCSNSKVMKTMTRLWKYWSPSQQVEHMQAKEMGPDVRRSACNVPWTSLVIRWNVKFGNEIMVWLKVCSLEGVINIVYCQALECHFKSIRERETSHCLIRFPYRPYNCFNDNSKQKRSTKGYSKLKSPETRQVQERLVSILERMQVPKWDMTRCLEE